MKENIQKKMTWFIVLLFIGAAFVSWNIFPHQATRGGPVISTAHAAEDDEFENENDDNYSSAPAVLEPVTKTTKVKSVPTYKKVLVTKVITTLDPVYTTDQDGDKIVDGLDPHPTVPETEYFTDDDSDGVPNAFDKHLGEDDYAYFEQDQDANGNGILDSYESLASN